jgi:Lsr2
MEPSGEEATVTSRTLLLLQDDIDGSGPTQTVGFAIDSTEYEIDLSERNANRFREALSGGAQLSPSPSGRRWPALAWSLLARSAQVP